MLKELKYNILIVSSNEKFNNSISRAFSNDIVDLIDYASNGSLARRILLERSYEIVIVNSPLIDEDGVELAIDAAEALKGVILFVKLDNYHEIYDKTHELGILTISKPTPGETFIQALRLLMSSRQRIHNATKNVSFKERLEEIRIVNEAKMLLIKYEMLSEEDAHKKIEKQAMNLRITKKRSAELIKRKYNEQKKELF